MADPTDQRYAAEQPPQRPGARERGRMRRRLRRQREVREALLLDLGALVYELHRHGRREPELLQAKAAELSAVDAEVRALADALDDDTTMLELVASGIAGSCTNCGTILSTDARYCAACGEPVVPELARENARESLRGAPQQSEPPAQITSEMAVPVPEPESEPDPQPTEATEAPVHDPGLELHTEDMPELRTEEEPEAVEAAPEPEPEPEAVEPEPEPEPEPGPEPEPAPEPEPEPEPEPKPEPEPEPEAEPEAAQPEAVEQEPEPPAPPAPAPPPSGPQRPGSLPPLAEFPEPPGRSGVLGRLRRRR